MSTERTSADGQADSRFDFVLVDESNRDRILMQCPSWTKYLRMERGFSVVALDANKPVGIVVVKWQQLPAPLASAMEGYIDIIEVQESCRRRGIARRLIASAASEARAHGVVQLRAWSTNDKIEAIPMWKHLGFTLSPVTHSMWKQTRVTGFFVAKRLD